MAYCPNCRAKIDINIASCPQCNADFGQHSVWKPTLSSGASNTFVRGGFALLILASIIISFPFVIAQFAQILQAIIPDCEVQYGSKRLCTIAGVDLTPIIGSMILGGGPWIWIIALLIGTFFGLLGLIAIVSQAGISTNPPAASKNTPHEKSNHDEGKNSENQKG